MAKQVTVRVVVALDDNDDVEILTASPPKVNKKGGFFLFEVENQTDKRVEVQLHDFKPDFVSITGPTKLKIKKGQTRSFLGEVTNAEPTRTPVKYSVQVDSVTIDPELIVEGVGKPNPPKDKKGNKKKKKK